MQMGLSNIIFVDMLYIIIVHHSKSHSWHSFVVILYVLMKSRAGTGHRKNYYLHCTFMLMFCWLLF